MGMPPIAAQPPSIARRLIVLVIAVIVPVLAFAGLMIARYAETERAGYETQMLATARALSLAVDREVAAQQTIVLALSGSSYLSNRDWRGFYDRAMTTLGNDPDRRIVVFDPSGQQILNTLLPFGSELPRSDLRPIRQVLETGAPYLSDLVAGAVAKRAALGVYVPVFQDGRVAYVLAMDFESERISRILREQRLETGWIAAIIDRNGIIVARNLLAETLVGQPVTSEYLEKIRASDEGIVESETKDGLPVLGAFTRSAVSGWTTGLAVENAVLNAPLIRSLWLLGGGGALLLFLVLSFASVYGARIARPVAALASMAASMGRGEPLPDLSLGIREAQIVADRMRTAARLLEARTREREALLATLEQRVAARTRELAESEARYRLLADNATDMIVHGDVDRVWRYVSPSCRALLGFEPEELVGRTAIPLLHPEDADPLAKVIRELRPGSEHMTSTFRMRRKDGAYVWIEATFNLLLDARSGAPASYVVVARDFTARKEIEERAERAAAQAMAANRAKSEFLASMSHELRTPLNAVIGFAQLMIFSKREPLPPRQREYVDYILRGANQLLELIKDVLDFAKIESGQLRVSIERVNAIELIEAFATLLRPLAEQKGLTLDIAPPKLRYPAIRADRARLLQVLMNLGSNAIKYNRPNGFIVVEAQPAEDGWFRISIADTGIGIPADRRGEAFEPFNRLGAERGAIEGTGIGLSICKRLIEMMKGRIDFTSETGRGSRFWVDLPEDRKVLAEAAPAAVTGSEELPSDQPAYSVLYIDDNPASLILMSRLVADLPNARILTASTGEMGVAIAIAHRPDIVIVDIHLPDISGYDVLTRLKAAPETAHIPVMALSADALPTDLARGRAAGFARYMTKPFAVPELMAAIREVVGTHAE